jgi:hypothetical protein
MRLGKLYGTERLEAACKEKKEGHFPLFNFLLQIRSKRLNPEK